MRAATDLPTGVGGSGEWSDGWTVVLASVGGTFAASLAIYSAGAFILPMEQAYGWSRTQTSLGLTIFSLVAVIGTPFVGMLVDKIGPRRVGLPATLLYLAGFALLGFAGPELLGWCLLWVLVAIGSLGTKPNVFGAAVTSRFDRHRGVALGIMLMGASLSMAIMPPLTVLAIGTVGVRWAFAVLAGATFIATAPLLWRFLRGAAELVERAAPAPIRPAALFAPVASRAFLQLAAATLAVSTTITAVAVHMVPLLVAKGMSMAVAAGISGTMGISSLFGRLAGGWLIDRLPARIVGGLIFALPIPAFILLIAADGTLPSALLAGAVIGFSLGGEVDVVAYLTSRIFGLATFGTLFGILTAAIALGGAIGPLLASVIFDATRSYTLMLSLSIPALGLGALALFTLPSGRT